MGKKKKPGAAEEDGSSRGSGSASKKSKKKNTKKNKSSTAKVEEEETNSKANKTTNNKSTKRLGGPPNGNKKGVKQKGIRKSKAEKLQSPRQQGGPKRLGGPPNGNTKKKKGKNATNNNKPSKASRKKQRALIEKARKKEQERMLRGGFDSDESDCEIEGVCGTGSESSRNNKNKKNSRAEINYLDQDEERAQAAKRRELRAKRAARQVAKNDTPTETLFAVAKPPKKSLERILAKLADSDGDQCILSRKEKKVYEQHLRAKAAAEAEELAAKDPLRYFTLSDLQSSSGAGHANVNDVVIESFTIHAVGPNGYGKTTVLRFLAERKLPIPKHISCLHVEQEVSASHLSALATVLAADLKRSKLSRELDRVHCLLDPITAQAKVDNLKATIESIAQKLNEISEIHVDAEGTTSVIGYESDDDDNAAARRKAAADQELSLTLSESKKTAELQLKEACDWLAQAQSETGGLEEEEGLIFEMERLYEEWDNTSAEAAEARACKVLAGLGFTEEMQMRETFKFSGGWRMRISLARALFMNPDMLLLDEPTNHLDIDTVLWLEHYIKNEFKGTLLVVSHDQDFLSEVCTSMVLLDDRELHFFNTTYDSFFDRQEQFIEQRKSNFAKQQHWINRRLRDGKGKFNRKDIKLQIESGKFAARESGAKQADFQPRLLCEPKDYSVNFTFPQVTDTSPYIDVDQVSFRYRSDLPLLFKNLDFPVNCATKATVVGPNGAGKSTLMQVIYGDLEPSSGAVNRRGPLRVGYFNQHFDDVLDVKATGVEFLRRSHPKTISSEQEAHKFLGQFGLGAHAHRIPISQMSGGQKARVVFAHLAAQAPHLLLLDEPTNNLDIQSINALIDGINSFNGGIIIISHDARLISCTNTELWLCDGFGNVKPLRQGFDKYRQQVLIDHTDRVDVQVRKAQARLRKQRKKHQKKIDAQRMKLDETVK